MKNGRWSSVISLLGALAFVVDVGCARGLDPAMMQSTGQGGASGDAGGQADATDARANADSQCQYDVVAVPVSTENPGDHCLFLVPTPDPNLPVDRFRILVNGTVVPEDSIAGWGFTDATERVIRIAGPVCDAIQAGSVQLVVVEWYCYGIA
jgi:hypothetical protein